MFHSPVEILRFVVGLEVQPLNANIPVRQAEVELSSKLRVRVSFPPHDRPHPWLREKESRINAERDAGIDSQGGNVTVMQLLRRYVELKSSDARETTKRGYRTQLNFMESSKLAQEMARKKIKDVDPFYAEEWLKTYTRKKIGAIHLCTLSRACSARRLRLR